MTVGARLHTTYWGLLKQPDNQKTARPTESVAGPCWQRICIQERRSYRLLPLGGAAIADELNADKRLKQSEPVRIHLYFIQSRYELAHTKAH